MSEPPRTRRSIVVLLRPASSSWPRRARPNCARARRSTTAIVSTPHILLIHKCTSRYCEVPKSAHQNQRFRVDLTAHMRVRPTRKGRADGRGGRRRLPRRRALAEEVFSRVADEVGGSAFSGDQAGAAHE